ncbi:MAG: type I-B CRISPR-associated protein Cas7/Cst2/DevR [Saprospiraceae bacterium]|nr:MAG: type I-B CRISPR-associated protein Cas7/Cst2/DevR [Saprospiraceae bacterium]
MNVILNNIAGTFLIDARAAFLNGAGLGSGEDRNKVIPKTFRERVNGRLEEVPYVSAQAWRRWLRNTTNEENNWSPSELESIGKSDKGSTSKISTKLNPISYPEDDLFGYMRSGSGSEESVQRTSPFKNSILKGIPGMRVLNNDEAFVHLKEGTPLPYSTRFYSTHLEGFFNLEYYRLGVYDNLGSHVELAKEFLDEYNEKLQEDSIYGKFKRYTLNNPESSRKTRAAGLLKGLVHLRGGAKQAAFGSDVAPKAIILAGMECANPVFNDLFDGSGEKPSLKISTLLEIVEDYKTKLATKVYIGIRAGYLANEEEVKKLDENFVVTSPVEAVNNFTQAHLK